MSESGAATRGGSSGAPRARTPGDPTRPNARVSIAQDANQDDGPSRPVSRESHMPGGGGGGRPKSSLKDGSDGSSRGASRGEDGGGDLSRGVSRGSGRSAISEKSESLSRQQAIIQTKQKDLKAKKNKLEQKGREAQRRREEALRGKEKEKELQRMEEEKKREELAAKQKAINERREENVRMKLVQRERVAAHQREIMEKHDALAAELRDRRVASVRAKERTMLDRHAAGEFKEARLVEAKTVALRRVFVLLDADGDGLVTEADMLHRMRSLGVNFDELDVESMFDDMRAMYGEVADGGGRGPGFWRWGMYLYQPELEPKRKDPGVWTPGWSRAATGDNSAAESLLDGKADEDDEDDDAVLKKHLALRRGEGGRPDSSAMPMDILRLFQVPPTRKHHDMVRNWNLESEHRIICADSADACTRGPEQHPPLISPRTPFDLAPQSQSAKEVCPVVITEGGMMTETDVKVHLEKSLGKCEGGFTWTELRDCFITYSVDQANESPIQFMSIVEFLMTDERGVGSANLEDAMELLFRRFGVPTDTMFVKLFGNECDPTTQMPLAEYLRKVDVLIRERTGKKSGKSTRPISRAQTAARRRGSLGAGGGMAEVSSKLKAMQRR